MRWKIAAVSLTLAALLPAAAPAVPDSLAGMARLALQGNPAESAGAVQALRQAGPAGMKALLAACPDGDCRGSRDVLDKVCGVHDCADIRLFWYTDLEAAKDAARAAGKPILSLRLLGRLDEELSCANSRFFRTVFYKNRSINRLLRDRYVLYWRSVRPVPRVTIDFGDGNRIEQPLTGNSIHYVLDSKGRLLEPLPGLYGPKAFELALEEAEEAARVATPMEDPGFAVWASRRYMRELDARAAAFSRDLKEIAPARQARGMAPGIRLAAFRSEEETRLEKDDTPEKIRDPWAVLMATPGLTTDRISVGGGQTGAKITYEQFLVNQLLKVDDEQLDNLARLRRPGIHLDGDSRAFMLRKQGVTDPESAARLIDNFETSMARDEVINQYRYSPVILSRLIGSTGEGTLEDLEALNLWVYKDVFQTPLDDPWLGLVPKDTYGALPAWTHTAAPRP